MRICLIKNAHYCFSIMGHAFNYSQQFSENLQHYLSQHFMSLSHLKFGYKAEFKVKYNLSGMQDQRINCC